MDDDTMSFGVSLTLILSLTPVKSDKLNKMELLWGDRCESSTDVSMGKITFLICNNEQCPETD